MSSLLVSVDQRAASYAQSTTSNMLYELIGIVRPHQPVAEIKEIARTAGRLILSRSGVVRGVTNWGTFLLPSPLTKAERKYFHGHYFIVRFDSDARTQHAVKRTLSLDPRMLRFSIVKMGQKFEEIYDIGGIAEWPARKERV